MKKREEMFGEPLHLRWAQEARHPRFDDFIFEAAILGLAEARSVNMPPSAEWFAQYGWKSAELTASVGSGSHGLVRAMQGIYRFFSIDAMIVRCDGNPAPEYVAAVRNGILEMANVQRILMQACLWLHDDDVIGLAKLHAKLRGENDWMRTLYGALATACVAKVLLNAGLRARYPDPETDVLDGVDLFAPDFPAYGPLAIQVKSIRMSSTMILPIEQPQQVCLDLGLRYSDDHVFMDQIYDTHHKVMRLNRRIGTSYLPMLVVIGGLDVFRPMSETVSDIAGGLRSRA